jgi:polar amino acid transport system permease protein
MFELINDYWLYFLVGQYPNGPLGGLSLTVLLSGAALLLAMPLGLVLGVARVSPWRAVRWPVAALVQVVRAVPLLLVVFWAYFFLPAVTGVKTGQATTMLMTLVLFDAVYLAEIVGAGKGSSRPHARSGWAISRPCAWCCCRRRCAMCCPRW